MKNPRTPLKLNLERAAEEVKRDKTKPHASREKSGVEMILSNEPEKSCWIISCTTAAGGCRIWRIAAIKDLGYKEGYEARLGASNEEEPIEIRLVLRQLRFRLAKPRRKFMRVVQPIRSKVAVAGLSSLSEEKLHKPVRAKKSASADEFCYAFTHGQDANDPGGKTGRWSGAASPSTAGINLVAWQTICPKCGNAQQADPLRQLRRRILG